MDQPDGPPAGRGPPGQGTHGDNKDIMSLAGLLTILDDDSQLHDVVAQADDDAAERGSPVSSAADAELTGEDLVAPPTLRPVRAAALPRRASADSPRFVLAVTATAREAEDLAAGLGSFLPPGSVAAFPGWETLPHERLSPRSDTVGQRIAVLRRLAHPADPGEPNGPLTVVAAPIRSLLQPIVAGHGDLEPVSLQAGRGCGTDAVAFCSGSGPGSVTSSRSASRRARCTSWTTCSRGWSRSATHGSTWSPAAVRSPSAAASSTCSRRPRSTRCGSSSSGTRWRRSVPSRSRTSAA